VRMKAYFIRVANGLRAAASNSASHSGGILTFAISLICFGARRAAHAADVLIVPTFFHEVRLHLAADLPAEVSLGRRRVASIPCKIELCTRAIMPAEIVPRDGPPSNAGQQVRFRKPHRPVRRRQKTMAEEAG